jgi:hypothetical protein
MVRRLWREVIGMTRTARTVARSGQARTTRAARRAVAQADRAAQIVAWQEQRAGQLREQERARAVQIAARETAIRDHTVDYVAGQATEQELTREYRRRCEQVRAQRAVTVAGMREQGLSRADIAELTGLTSREITAFLDTARDAAGQQAGQPTGEAAAEDPGGRVRTEVAGGSTTVRAGGAATGDGSAAPADVRAQPAGDDAREAADPDAGSTLRPEGVGERGDGDAAGGTADPTAGAGAWREDADRPARSATVGQASTTDDPHPWAGQGRG